MTTTAPRHGFGIDVGGSAVKGARVDLTTGEFIGERFKIATPRPATPEAIAHVIVELLQRAEWLGPVGITLPSVVHNSIAHSAANIDPEWIGVNTTELFRRFLGDRDFTVLNDADAAGLAEVAYGDPRAREGAVLFLTFGTGIGSAMLVDGRLFPNTELGHMIVGKQEAEHQASSAVKDNLELNFKQWASRVNVVMGEYEKLFNPTTFIVGGGISRKFDKWGPSLDLKTPVFPAQLRNRAGIVGAALAMDQGMRP